MKKSLAMHQKKGSVFVNPAGFFGSMDPLLPCVTVAGGFPSPAEDFSEERLDIRQYLIKNPASTFFARVRGDSMREAGISDGDLLVVDRSIRPSDGKIAVCFLNGEFTLKRLRMDGPKIFLMPANPRFRPIEVGPEEQFTVWGIVTHVIKSF
ncbi:MAG: translesion error-prone DNA polymerase V autoproteolytic subunit [Bacteroidia bacterium]|nr:translesion error-prone DNA polymerase V autoproteolytic subunit [Bacteroidia bacterium]